MDVHEVAVIGAGTMGAGIAQVFAQHAFSVLLVDSSRGALDQGRRRIESGLGKFVEKGKLTFEDRDAALGRLQCSAELSAAGRAQLVIEAVFENPDVKMDVLRRLGELCPAETVLASNTSSISITRLASGAGRPERFLGFHFMNPVPLMPLVELIRGEETSSETMQLAVELCRRIGKTPLEAHDFPGFISNRILMPMINEAVYALMEGVGTREAIDGVMTLGMNHPMGPLALADLIGLDVCLSIMEVLHHGLGDKYRPCPLLRRMVSAGKLGKKSGVGFYSYSSV
ncbi:MAG: 3-hydroxybutyryl-CoA dehydrogenase [Armatimonadetes bacterium]|nr:3-hydroxybutyryl-CoA dehydrogenase [Armatimonadota bacterium]